MTEIEIIRDKEIEARYSVEVEGCAFFVDFKPDELLIEYSEPTADTCDFRLVYFYFDTPVAEFSSGIEEVQEKTIEHVSELLNLNTTEVFEEELIKKVIYWAAL